MISDILAITDRLFGFLVQTKEDQKVVFEKVFEPIFNDLMVIHKNYITMFYEVLNSLNDPDVPIIEIIRHLQVQRTEFEPIRDQNRAIISRFQSDQLNFKDKAFIPFLQSLFRYLPEGEMKPYGTEASAVIFQLGLYEEDFESRYLQLSAGEIYHARREITQLVEMTINRIRRNWAMVCEEYVTLKMNVYSIKK
jgi:hypothetical protein